MIQAGNDGYNGCNASKKVTIKEKVLNQVVLQQFLILVHSIVLNQEELSILGKFMMLLMAINGNI